MTAQRSARSHPQHSRQWAASVFAQDSASELGWNGSAFCGSAWPADRRNGPTRSLRHQPTPFFIRNSLKYSNNPYATPTFAWSDIAGPQPITQMVSPCAISQPRKSGFPKRNQIRECGRATLDTSQIGSRENHLSAPPQRFVESVCNDRTTRRGKVVGVRRMNRVNRNGTSATTVVGNTLVAHERRKLSSREKRALFATVIGHLPEKIVAESAECSPQAVRLWKAEERTVSSDALLDLAHDYDSVWKYICVAAGRADALRKVDADFHEREIVRLSAEVEALKAIVRRK